MRIQPSALADMFTGKFGNVVYAASKGSSSGTIQTARQYTKPFNPNTTDQQFVRNAFAKGIAFVFNAETTVRGATTFDKTIFDNSLIANMQASYQYGMATTGVAAGRQAFAGAMVKEAPLGDIDNLLAGKLPQDCADEAELIGLISEIDVVLERILALQQQKKIGYLDVNKRQ